MHAILNCGNLAVYLHMLMMNVSPLLLNGNNRHKSAHIRIYPFKPKNTRRRYNV